MSNSFALSQASLLEPNGLNSGDLPALLAETQSPQIDYADIYLQYRSAESWVLEEQRVKSGSYHIEQGVGVRAISGDKTGFAYTDHISAKAIREAGQFARQIGTSLTDQTTGSAAITPRSQAATALYSPLDPIPTMSDQRKVELLKHLDALARSLDTRVKEVTVSLAGGRDDILIAASDGTFAGDVRPLVRMNVSVIAEQDGRRETGSMGGGGRFSYDYFVEADRAESYVQEAVRLALVNLEAVSAPAGELTVVLGSGWPGILLHEAIGHGLEGDFNRKQTSAFSGRIGDKVAADGITVVDNGTIKDRRGSLSIDDEGTPSQNTVLIEDGILKAYMQDKLNARLMGMTSTGNGRRESYAHLPMPRMTNTYMLAGQHDPDSIISSVEEGLFAVNFGGGQVDITSGKFVFTASEAYRIKNGKVCEPVKGATLIGNGPDVLTRVSMVGNDLELDSGVGNCGKDGQSVPVGVGQPTLRIDGLTVGGDAL